MRFALPVFAFLIVMLPLAGHAAMDAHVEKIRAFCVAAWPDKGHLQMNCAERQAKSYRAVRFIMDRYPRGSEQRGFVRECALNWKTSGGGYDWPRVHGCADIKLQRHP